MEKKIENKKEEKAEVEVVETNELQKLMIKKLYKEYIDNIANSMEEVVYNYLTIGHALREIKLKHLYELEGYKNIYELSKEKFNLGETSTKNFINVYLKFGDSRNVGCLKNDYEKYSFSQLVELLPVSEDDIKNYSPSMSVQEIKQIKKDSQVSDDFKKYTKEFSKMVDKVKDTFIKEMGIEEELKSCKIDVKYNDKTFQFEAIINIQSNNYNDEVTFRLSIDGLKFEYFISCKKNYCVWFHKDQFLSCLEELKSCIKQYKNNIYEREQQELKRQIASKKELEEFADSKLKTDEEREDFAKDENNWSVLQDIRVGNCLLRISTFNINSSVNDPLFVKINILDCEEMFCVENISGCDEVEELACDYSSEYEVARYLREIKY